MGENTFTDTMKQRTNDELVNILTTERNNYEPEALFAAELELKDRGLSEKEMERIRRKVEMSNKMEELKHKRSLNRWTTPGFLVTIIIAVPGTFLTRGEGWVATFIMALIAFGAGHLANHFYNKRKGEG